MYTAFTESVIGHQMKTPIKMNVNINVNNFFNSTSSKSEQRLNSAQVTRRNKKYIDFTANSGRNSRKHTHNKHSSELPELTYSSMRKNSFTLEKERKLNESKSIDTMSVLKRQIDNINIDTINIDFDNLPSERNPNTTRTSGKNTSNCDQTFSPSRHGFQSRNNKNSVLKTITSNTITNINNTNTTNNNNITLGTNKDSSMSNSKKTVKSLKTIFSLKKQIKKNNHKKLNRRKSVLIPKSSSRKLYGLITIKNKLQKQKLNIITILDSYESPVERVKVGITFNVMQKIKSKISDSLEKNKIERTQEIYSRKREERRYFNKVILRNLSKMQMYLKYFQLKAPKNFSLNKYLADLLNEVYFGNVVYTMIYIKHVEKRPSRINRNTKLKRKGMHYSITRQYIFHKFEANEWQGKESKILNGKINNPKLYTERYGSMDKARENITLRLSNLVFGPNMIAPVAKKTSSKKVSVILPDRAPSKKGTKIEQRSGSRKGTVSNGPSRKSSSKNQSPNDRKDSMQKAVSAKNGLVLKNKSSSIKSRPSIQSNRNEKLNSSIRILSHKDLLKRKVKYKDEEVVEKKNPFNFHIYDQEKEMQTIKTMAKESLIYRTQEIKMKMKENLKTIEDILFFLIKENNFKEFKELIEKYRVDLESTDRNGNTFLIYATACGFKEFVEYLLDSGAYINAQNDDLNTALHIALIFKNFTISDFLLKKGANEKIVNNYGYTPWETLDREVYKVVG